MMCISKKSHQIQKKRKHSTENHLKEMQLSSFCGKKMRPLDFTFTDAKARHLLLLDHRNFNRHISFLMLYYNQLFKVLICSGVQSDGPFNLHMPVLDGAFIRKSWRRKGWGTIMIKDFISTFPEEDYLGFSEPISNSLWLGIKQKQNYMS